jgi:hypothetical protein
MPHNGNWRLPPNAAAAAAAAATVSLCLYFCTMHAISYMLLLLLLLLCYVQQRRLQPLPAFPFPQCLAARYSQAPEAATALQQPAQCRH